MTDLKIDANQTSGALQSVVVGYFANGDDAHRAINQLLEEGIDVADIGAAFHSSRTDTRSAATAYADDALASESDVRTTTSDESSASGIAGPSSGTAAVTPAGLSTGGGTVIAGVGRPGPIPGSDIPSDLPSSLPRSVPLSSASTLDRGKPVASAYPATSGYHEDRNHEAESWWDKLKHVFGGETGSQERELIADKTSMNFGTGEGHLGALSESEYAYSGPAFESAFSGMGVPQEHARRLSSEISRGGAIVTVDAGTRAAIVEHILEENQGRVRYEAGSFAADQAIEGDPAQSRVQLFGRVQRVYPDYVRSDVQTRKAS